MKAYAAGMAMERTGRPALTLRDVFGAAESVSAGLAPEIVHALFASGRVRFVNADVQRELDAVAELLAPAGQGAA